MTEERHIYVTESVKLKREQWVRLRMIQKSLEEEIGRKISKHELFEVIIEEFLGNQKPE